MPKGMPSEPGALASYRVTPASAGPPVGPAAGAEGAAAGGAFSSKTWKGAADAVQLKVHSGAEAAAPVEHAAESPAQAEAHAPREQQSGEPPASGLSSAPSLTVEHLHRSL